MHKPTAVERTMFEHMYVPTHEEALIQIYKIPIVYTLLIVNVCL